MQTFLPYSNFIKTFEVLDYKRLGKQRVEAMQLLNILTGIQKTKGWINHPATLMWKGYENALSLYHDMCIVEWVSRGYKNNMELRFFKNSNIDKEALKNFKFTDMPWWMNNEEMHRSHRARLIEKDEDFYLRKFPNDKGFNNGNYFWPVNETKTFRCI